MTQPIVNSSLDWQHFPCTATAVGFLKKSKINVIWCQIMTKCKAMGLSTSTNAMKIYMMSLKFHRS